MLKFKFVLCVPQQMEPQPHALPQTLNVVLETCREQEKIVKLSEACYCCKGYDQPCLPNRVTLSAICYCCVGYDRPCLQSPPTNWTLMHNQGFGEHSQPSFIPPPVALREDNQHMVEIPAQGNNVPNMDLSNWTLLAQIFAHLSRGIGVLIVGNECILLEN